MAERSDMYASCPYYLGIYSEKQRKKGQIRCEGVSKGNSISLVFGSDTKRKDYKQRYCYSVLGCRDCLIHKMLNGKYGVDDGI